MLPKYLVPIAAAAGLAPLVFMMATTYDSPAEQNQADREAMEEYFLRGAISDTSAGKQLDEENRAYLCGTSFDNQNRFITEYSIPFPCSQPVGITVDKNDNIWIAATWSGYLMVFDPETKTFTKYIKIPDWKTKGTFGSMVWGMEFDSAGNLWFTDQVNNAIWRYFVEDDRFEMYRVPTRGSYPLNMVFDSQGNVWFSQIFGKNLAVLNPSQVVHNTTRGITEYKTPESIFDPEVSTMTMGPVSIDDEDNIWFTAIDYPDGGQIVRFDKDTEEFHAHDLREVGIPFGINKDEHGRLWVNDHDSNLFLMFDAETGKTVRYSTSLPTSRNSTTTLPYWNTMKDGRLWFNEHEGNAIAYFDTKSSTLVEYQIPTRPQTWGNTTNPLKFDIDSKGSVWFTEWSENKIGVLAAEKIDDLPISVSVPEDSIVVDASSNKKYEIPIDVSAERPGLGEPVKMTVAGSISSSGRLWNVTAEFDRDSFYFESAELQTVVLKLTPKTDLVAGEYTLTIGARYGEVTVSRIVKLTVN